MTFLSQNPLIAFVLTILMVAQHCVGADRVALVIGNSAYRHANDLPNATRDAASISDLLTSTAARDPLSHSPIMLACQRPTRS